MAFLPLTKEEAAARGWRELDVIFVTGDAYIDHPAFGVPLLARWLEFHGFRVGIIAQPDWRSRELFLALGRPRLFFAVSAGAMDSMVAHYTPARKLRHDDAYTPGNRHGARPNRATIVYTSRLKECFRDVPVVIGGIEASLRRHAHYDYWEDKVRRSLLVDAKADLLVFGMGERPLLEVAQRLRSGEPFSALTDIRGTALMAREAGADAVVLPSFEAVAADRLRYAEAFRLAADETNPFCARAVAQRHGERYVVCNPPALPLSEAEMDALYALPFARAPHPSYKETIPAYEQIKASVTTHRGCFGGCSFCAITHHQGKFIQSRSESSIAGEIERMVRMPWFRGSVSDVGGATANMYGLGCGHTDAGASCRKESCLYPRPCRHLVTSDRRAAALLRRVRGIRGVTHAAVSSGVRYDLLERQPRYLEQLLAHHVGGRLKVAPEHVVGRVTNLMHKPGAELFERFLSLFLRESARLGKRQFVVPYLISGHPGCTLEDMVELALFLKKHGLRVEQVQDFTPTPGSLSTCMYYSGIDPATGRKVHVARSDREKLLQKALLLWHQPNEWRHLLEALRSCGKEDVARLLLSDERYESPARTDTRRRLRRGK
ncbi:YgiQ family radical SAM protein [Geobacter sp.]|uniref:YgiQ family radical SAM protein n=1 Tax=Geobacter sp. TaxID=46610 RepID=UPI00261A8852|nr:YgiQ family radical SAM protein [Geobacter sp.]